MPGERTASASLTLYSMLTTLIATLERLIVKKQAIKQGMMQQLLTRQDPSPGLHG